MINLLVAGEGPNELGRPEEVRRGVVEALLSKVRTGGWRIRDFVVWSDIHKLRPNDPGRGDGHNVLRLIHHARERGCHAVVFIRDRDRDRRRERSIEAAIRKGRKSSGQPCVIIGGVAVENLEAWLLALRGTHGTESLAEAEVALERDHGIPMKKTGPMVNLVNHARLRDIPEDAASLRRWLRRAAVGLDVRVPRAWP